MFLKLSHVEVRYPGQMQPAVHDVSLNLEAGQIGVLIGPSGCGKTSLLRAIAGLENVSGGEILLSDRVVSRLRSSGALAGRAWRRAGGLDRYRDVSRSRYGAWAWSFKITLCFLIYP